MKLATYKDGSRDGQLVVVSRDLSSAHYPTGIASRLQQVLDDWTFLAPQLQDLSVQLNAGRVRHNFPFDPRQCMAPLPRATQYLGAVTPALQQSTAGTPLMYQGASDDFLGPCDDVPIASEAMGIDFGAEVAVITGDVRRACTPEQALDSVRLLLLANAVCLRQLLPAELERGWGPLQARPTTAFSPVAVTLDELGSAWQGGRLHWALQSSWNGRKVGLSDAGAEMPWHFGQLIAHAARTRSLRAGSIVASGTVRSPAVPASKGRTDWPKGYHCLADKRAIETLQDGQPSTDYLRFGDTLRIEMKGADGHSLCGAIDQAIAPVATAG
ncbi:fumarylacetoacetate hydrolase family protein [Simplicispira psychrophila]|uniref:fumarylacetoacetate hydrolase family protein n=1 Tax=Simplicispira psychrophila TaxID=80882 RepID=UPI000482D8AF|nr:fumarylacetoacetate hydrolase family protein [Simplicispira psychrophila]